MHELTGAVWGGGEGSGGVLASILGGDVGATVGPLSQLQRQHAKAQTV